MYYNQISVFIQVFSQRVAITCSPVVFRTKGCFCWAESWAWWLDEIALVL